jgi:hypothetical protein
MAYVRTEILQFLPPRNVQQVRKQRYRMQKTTSGYISSTADVHASVSSLGLGCINSGTVRRRTYNPRLGCVVSYSAKPILRPRKGRSAKHQLRSAPIRHLVMQTPTVYVHGSTRHDAPFVAPSGRAASCAHHRLPSFAPSGRLRAPPTIDRSTWP